MLLGMVTLLLPIRCNLERHTSNYLRILLAHEALDGIIRGIINFFKEGGGGHQDGYVCDGKKRETWMVIWYWESMINWCRCGRHSQNKDRCKKCGLCDQKSGNVWMEHTDMGSASEELLFFVAPNVFFFCFDKRWLLFFPLLPPPKRRQHIITPNYHLLGVENYQLFGVKQLTEVVWGEELRKMSSWRSKKTKRRTIQFLKYYTCNSWEYWWSWCDEGVLGKLYMAWFECVWGGVHYFLFLLLFFGFVVVVAS